MDELIAKAQREVARKYDVDPELLRFAFNLETNQKHFVSFEVLDSSHKLFKSTLSAQIG